MSSANFLPILFCFTIWRRFTRHTFFMRKLFWNFSYKYIWFLEMIMFSILHGTRKKSNKIDSDCISREVSDYVCLQWWNWYGCWFNAAWCCVSGVIMHYGEEITKIVVLTMINDEFSLYPDPDGTNNILHQSCLLLLFVVSIGVLHEGHNQEIKIN